jgi:hypothetical protein
MHAETKIVPIDGVNYQLRRMTPTVGGYLWQRLMAALYKAKESSAPQPEEKEDETKPKPSTEERLRGMCGVCFVFMSFDDYEFVQKRCMLMVEREEPGAGFLAVQLSDGRWVSKEVEANPLLVTKLMVEVLVFNLHSFLD